MFTFSIGTKEDQKRYEYQDREKLKVIKKYAKQELAGINREKLLSPYDETRKEFLNFVLKAKRFAGLPITSFPQEALEEIRRLPFMEDEIYFPETVTEDTMASDETEAILIEQINFHKARLIELLEKARQRKENYVKGPGQASKEIGEEGVNRALTVLEKCGGIAGYDGLPIGQKKPITDEIEKKCRFKEPRQVYNILKKIRLRPKA